MPPVTKHLDLNGFLKQAALVKQTNLAPKPSPYCLGDMNQHRDLTLTAAYQGDIVITGLSFI